MRLPRVLLCQGTPGMQMTVSLAYVHMGAREEEAATHISQCNCHYWMYFSRLFLKKGVNSNTRPKVHVYEIKDEELL